MAPLAHGLSFRRRTVKMSEKTLPPTVCISGFRFGCELIPL